MTKDVGFSRWYDGVFQAGVFFGRVLTSWATVWGVGVVGAEVGALVEVLAQQAIGGNRSGFDGDPGYLFPTARTAAF